MKTHIGKGIMNVEWHEPWLIQQGLNIIKQDTCIKFYAVSKPSCLERDAFAISLGVGLYRKGMV